MKRTWFNRSKLVAVFVALLSVTVATIGVKISEPPEFESSRGTVGETVDFSGGELTIDKVQVGTQLNDEGEEAVTTKGLFFSVQVTVAAPRDKTIASRAKLISGEYEYESYQTINIITAEPGYQTTNEWFFEVDPAHIDDLTLEVWQFEPLSGFQEHAVIDLGISARNADQWREAGDGQVIEMLQGEVIEVIS